MSEITTGEWIVPREVYHSDRECICNSALTDFRKSVPYFYGRHIAGTIRKEPSEAMNLGTALHLLALEPHRFDDEIAVAPDCDKRTKGGKATWAAFCERAGRRLIISEEQNELCAAMAESLLAHSKASEALTAPGPVERAIRWRDEESGLWVRNLMDKWIPSANLVVDLKTAADPTPAAFAKSVASFNYYCQDALYRRGAREVYGTEIDFLFIVVGSAPPHEVCCYLLDHEAINMGHRLNQSALNEIAKRRESGDWTSRYANRIETINLPRWAFYQEYQQ